MALYYDLNVFKDVYKLILMVFEVTKDFSERLQVPMNCKANLTGKAENFF
jgi:hypothetical protein